MRRRKREPVELWKDERGIALPMALMALVLLTTMSLALLAVGKSEVQISSNFYRVTQAQNLADAGLEDALHALIASPSNVQTAPSSLATVPGLSGPGSSLSAVGSYTVKYRTAGTNTVEVVATGTTTGGATRTLRALMSSSTKNIQQLTGNNAILTGGNLTIQGAPIIDSTAACSASGIPGSAHTDGSLTIPGSPTLTGSLTSTGTYNASGSPTVGTGQYLGGGYPNQTVPTVNPSDFLNAAIQSLPASQVFQFKSDGRVLDGNGNLLTTLSNSQSYQGFKYQSGSNPSWSDTGTAYNGFFYFEGTMNITHSEGTSSTPWQASFVTTKDINITGSPDISPMLTNTLFIAGTDAKITGSPDLGYNGLIAAHEQIAISGTPHVIGAMIAQTSTSTDNFVTTDQISNSPHVTYDCNMALPNGVLGNNGGGAQVVTWGY